MNVYHFLKTAKSANWSLIIFLSAVSGLAGAAILAIINMAAVVEGADSSAGMGADRLVILYLLAITIYVVAKRISLFRTTEIVESLVADFRLRICEKLRFSELEVIERLNKSETFTTISQDTRLISQTGFVFTNAGQQAVMLLMGALYLAWISKMAFVLFVTGAGLGGWFFLRHRQTLLDAYRKDSDKQTELFSYLGHLLYGFKEVRLNENKGDEILSEMSAASGESRQLKLQTNMFYLTSSLYADVTLYTLLGTVTFILPQMIPTYSDVLMRAIIAVMFVFAPLAGVVASLPQIASANDALAKLYRLERKLDEHLDETAYLRTEDVPSLVDFQKITLQGVVFSYAELGNQEGFTVGPINLDIRRGEILFLVGGNGSGKTTLLKLIAGLYRPQLGELIVDRKNVTRRLLPAYRSLFAGVFSDFHLFDRLFGLGEIDEEVARQLLEKMEISNKVDIVEGRFTTLELSTGQRKRLALIASLLENREIYIFDEWTADQDPHFREQFYGSILPELQAQGKTILAITHDDRYWSCADRVIRLDYGQILPL